MNSTAPQLTHVPGHSVTPRAISQRRQDSVLPASSSWYETISETLSMIGAPAYYGPPVIFLLGPWLLLVLVLIGPFVLILTVLLALAVAVSLLAILLAVIASPYLLVRHLHANGIAHGAPRNDSHLVTEPSHA